MNAKLVDLETRVYLQAYADGINAYAKNVKLLPFEFYLFWIEWEDWTIEDTMANLAFMAWTLDFDWMY